MENAKSQILPTPPSLMRSLTAGFDVITRHIGLILFSIGMDLLLWFGPQIRLLKMITPFLEEFNSIPELKDTGSTDLLIEGFSRLNLISLLRTFPIGIPSMMALRSPIDTPLLYKPLVIDLGSTWAASVGWILITVTGICLGAFYFSLISQASLDDRLDFRSALSLLPRNFGNILLLSVAWIIALFIFMFPVSCIMSFSVMLGFGAGQFPFWLALFSGALIVWFIIPLFFSPHGIIASHKSVKDAILQSIRISRSTFGLTSVFIFMVGIISQGLNILWNRPTDNSWFLLVGIFGHAFVNAGLISATFLYYRDAEVWLKHWTEKRQVKLT